MEVDISTGLIYRNPKPHVSSKHAYFPSVIVMENGEMLASYVIGEAFEAINLATYVSHSKDSGVTWSQPKLLVNKAHKFLSNCSRITSLPSGSIVAIMVQSHREDHIDEGLANPINLGFVPTDILLIRSDDFGNSWTTPQVIIPPLSGPSFELCSPIVTLKDGRWIWPTSTWRNWEGYSPHGMKMIALISNDEGVTWPEYSIVMDGVDKGIIYWEGKIVEITNGTLLAVAWAYNEIEGIDLPNQFCLSYDHGKTWTQPSSTNILGQTMAIEALQDGRLLCVYRRIDKPGLWLTITRLENGTWNNEDEIPLWGSQSKNQKIKSVNMVQEFNELKFGAPCITLLPDGFVYIAFWCYEDMVSNIRWFKLKL